MTFSVSACLLVCLSAFALLCHVQAGFCDDKSGYHCRSSSGPQTFCRCKQKYDKKKKKYESDCDNEGDTICQNGCSSNTGRCQRADAVCATQALNNVIYSDSTGVHELSKMCPAQVMSTYFTWKNRQQNTDAKEALFLKEMVITNNIWSKNRLLPQFYTSNSGNGTVLAKGVAAMTAAWVANCNKATNQQMNCYVFFPKCQFNRGSNTNCLALCKRQMTCVDTVTAACTKANTADPSLCQKYENFGPRNGVTKCSALCGEYQNDYVASASTVGSLMVATIASIVAFAM